MSIFDNIKKYQVLMKKMNEKKGKEEKDEPFDPPTELNLGTAVLPLLLDSEDDESIECTVFLRSCAQFLQVGSASHIGTRSYQQDSVKVTTDFIEHVGKENLAIALLCDGMGGLKGGERASNLCTSMIYDDFYASEEIVNYNKFLIQEIHKADDMVCALTDEAGNPIKSGSTLTSVIIDDDLMYYASVGDSRIYLIRNGEAILLTQDHNYLLKLMQDVRDGLLTEAEAYANPNKGALLSYIGMGGISLICNNPNPINLQHGDYILLCSDGLYRCLSPAVMVQIVNESEDDMIAAANRLVFSALASNARSHDNTSAIVIKYLNDD